MALSLFPLRTKQFLTRTCRRLAEGRLPRLWRWWISHLLAMVPRRWRTLLSPLGAHAYYQVSGSMLHLKVASPDGDQSELRLPLPFDDSWTPSLEASTRIARSHWLVLPDSQVLRQRLTLPSAALDRLRDVLAFEIDRQTPFPPDRVVFGHRLLDHDRSARQRQVELVVLPKASLEAALAPLSILEFDGVDVCTSKGDLLGVNLLPDDRRRQHHHPGLGLNLILSAASLMLIVLTLAQVLGNRAQALEATRIRVNAVRTEALESSALRERLDLAVKGASFLDRIQSEKPALIEALAELTRQLPDGTWLERLTIKGDQVSLEGFSNEAPALVALLRSSHYLRDTALSGPVQADPQSGSDRFTLVAKLTSSPVEDAKHSTRRSGPDVKDVNASPARPSPRQPFTISAQRQGTKAHPGSPQLEGAANAPTQPESISPAPQQAQHTSLPTTHDGIESSSTSGGASLLQEPDDAPAP